MSYCKVNNCCYNTEHTTERHCCGTCKLNGHGKLECSNDDKIKELEQFNGDVIGLSCNIKDCLDPTTHTTKGHSCLYCDTRSKTHLKYCPQNMSMSMKESGENSICDNIEDFSKDITENIREKIVNKGEYGNFYAGMGCSWFIRNNNGTIEYLFMHSDSWGQYGEDSSHLPRYKAFIYGFYKVNKFEKFE